MDDPISFCSLGGCERHPPSLALSLHPTCTTASSICPGINVALMQEQDPSRLLHPSRDGWLHWLISPSAAPCCAESDCIEALSQLISGAPRSSDTISAEPKTLETIATGRQGSSCPPQKACTAWRPAARTSHTTTHTLAGYQRGPCIASAGLPKSGSEAEAQPSEAKNVPGEFYRPWTHRPAIVSPALAASLPLL